MRFIASIEFKDGSVVTLPLSCREYYAQKLQYVLSRTLDRSKVVSCSVLAVTSAVQRDTQVEHLSMCLAMDDMLAAIAAKCVSADDDRGV